MQIMLQRALSLTYVVVPALLLVAAVANTAHANPLPTGHLVYDSVDHLWRCLGSASNCA